MQKRGISPLIASILVIGFTIVLAAFVLVWGRDIYDYYQEKTTFSNKLEIACSELSIDTKNLCVLGSNVTGKIENRGNINISSIILRVKGEEGASLANLTGLPVYNVISFNIPISLHHYNWSLAYNEAVGKPFTLEIIPSVLIKTNNLEKEASCSNLIERILDSCYKLPSLDSWGISGSVKIKNDIISPTEVPYSAILTSPSFTIPKIKYIYTKINISGSTITLKLNSESQEIIESSSGYYMFDKAIDVSSLNGKNAYFTLEVSGNSLDSSIILYENCYSNDINCIV